jgi:hypothetical protein
MLVDPVIAELKAKPHIRNVYLYGLEVTNAHDSIILHHYHVYCHFQSHSRFAVADLICQWLVKGPCMCATNHIGFGTRRL